MNNHYTAYRLLWSKILVSVVLSVLLLACKSGSKTMESSGKTDERIESIGPTESQKTGFTNKDSAYKTDPQPMKEAPKPGKGPK